ncbi:ribonuclease H [Rhizobium sp. P28RR-XV]|uniref:ribonuclease H family protein n=1 Tax=Rhizobium sp. P28RR-XV TaxID=2726737 RepID=UPI001456F443|nr:ribonuclease H [Rhizobium sp. P28RR-XV]NLR86166.1 ribonuclease HI [Rhizobium sp. P28RR-XV]
MQATLHIYTDGSFDAASNSGGWAFVVLEGDRQVHSASGSDIGSSNNAFEVLAAVKAMSWIEAGATRQAAILWTDSNHVVDGCRRWRVIWRSNGWKRINPNPRARRRSIPDAHLWQQLDVLLERHPDVVVAWCKGHSGTAGNDHADVLARDVARIRTHDCAQRPT